MPGFFGFFDYTKPGKGIEKDDPEKHPFFLFFELLWRKLGRLILLNVIFFIILIPIVTAVYVQIYGDAFEAQLQQDSNASLLPIFLYEVWISLPAVAQYILLGVSAVLYGPASCATAYMLRNFTQQRHAWNSDFWDKLKENFKQGLALGLLDILLFGLFAFNLSITAGLGGGLMTVARVVSMALMFIYLMMRNYTYLMAVTFELRLSQLLKNAWIFAVMGLWRNILTLVINGGLILLTVAIHPIAELLVMPLILFSLTGFVSVFMCFPVLKKHMLDKQAQPQAADPSEA